MSILAQCAFAVVLALSAAYAVATALYPTRAVALLPDPREEWVRLVLRRCYESGQHVEAAIHVIRGTAAFHICVGGDGLYTTVSRARLRVVLREHYDEAREEAWDEVRTVPAVRP